MISFLSWYTFWFFVSDVERTQSVRIFKNTIGSSSAPYISSDNSVASKTCLLNPDQGPCRSKIKMLYFDPATSNCSVFEWGGCQGNGNRFNSFRECFDTCLTKNNRQRKPPRYCQLTFDYGYCFGSVQRYYYDRMWKVCKSTIYSGCGGNKNNFYNLEQCENVCRFGIGASTSKKPKGPGQKKTMLIINPPESKATNDRLNLRENPNGTAEANKQDSTVTTSTTVAPPQGDIESNLVAKEIMF